MFSDQHAQMVEEAEKIGTLTPIDCKETLALLEKAATGESLSNEEIIAVLNGLDRPDNHRTVLEFAREYRRPHRDEVMLLPPLYFSSVCENSCLYCNFSNNGGVRLSHGQFLQEVDALLSMGYRSVELVSSQDPKLYVRREPFDLEDQRFDVHGVVPYFEILQHRLSDVGGGMITSNIPPVCSEGLGKLKEAGLDCFLAWLETFHPGQYARLHNQVGPKGSQVFRIDSFERAFDAGIEHVAGAFLKGLYDWRREEAVLYSFDRYLKASRGRGFSIIGSPRLKGDFTRSPLTSEYLVSDYEYTLNIALDRILFDGVLWLQTREAFDFNRSLIREFGGGVILTIDCSTAPGGYSQPAEAAAQFPVFYEDLMRGVATLERDGLTVRFDWSAHELSACQRTGGPQD